MRDLRGAGEGPSLVIGRAAAAIGLIGDIHPLDATTAGALAAATCRGQA